MDHNHSSVKRLCTLRAAPLSSGDTRREGRSQDLVDNATMAAEESSLWFDVFRCGRR